MINIFSPNTEQLARGTAVHLAVRFGMQTGKPFEASGHMSKEGEPTLSELRELEGQTWLTTLKITHGAKSFTFEECLISINLEKNIVTTALQGRNGTIKEYISDGDYNITVDAGVSAYPVQNEENEIDISYPIDAVKELQELLALPEALEVQSDFLDIFGIDSAVVKSFSLQQETHANRQSINIQMLSDRAYEIRLKEENDVKVV